jgi:hypothetical protein
MFVRMAGRRAGTGNRIQRKKQADYILAVKDNQKTLYEDIRDYFEGLEQQAIRELPDDIGETGEERGHGRIERREVRTVTDLGWLSGKGQWKDLKTIIQYRSFRTANGERVKTDRYYISSSDCMRKVHTQEPACAGEPLGRYKGYGP